MTKRLTRSQTLLNQRLLAEHCLEEDKIRRIWDSITSKNDNEQRLSLEETLAVCNEQLAVVGLEIVSVSMQGGTKYFCLINKFPDDISRKAFEHLFQPQQHAYVRVVLEKLVNDGPTKRIPLLNARKDKSSDANNDNNQEGDNPKNETCDRMSLSLAEQVLETLTEEKLIEKVKTDEGAIAYALAPRAYAELAYLLEKEFGMDKDDLPQHLYYR